jgi:hypothetical protein
MTAKIDIFVVVYFHSGNIVTVEPVRREYKPPPKRKGGGGIKLKAERKPVM